MSNNLSLYGRKFSLVVKFPPNDNGEQTVLTVADSDAFAANLRITFDVFTAAYSVFWFADITIYNLDQYTTQQLLGAQQTSGPTGVQQGMEVILQAGYQTGPQVAGTIWDGYVLQAMFDRENVTDFKITLHCVIGLDGATRNFIAQNYGAGLTEHQLVQKMAKDSFRPIPIKVSDAVDQTQKSSRGEVIFGNPSKHISAIAQNNNCTSWLDAQGFNIADFSSKKDVSPADPIVYTPTTGIVGTPVETQAGANIRVLLDPRVRTANPRMLVAVDNTVIRQLPQFNGVIGLISPNQQYIVTAVRHTGDTRGQEWYTDITGINSVLGLNQLALYEGAQAVQSGRNN